MSVNPLWQKYLGPDDEAVIARARFGLRMGFGSRPAVIVIDAQRYMVGEEGNDAAWPSSCGAVGRNAVQQIARVVGAAQGAGVPCFFTRFEIARDGRDMGVYRRKRALLDNEHWCLEGSPGAELVPDLVPGAGDIVFVKKKPSGFHGTPLLGYLVERGIDTVIATACAPRSSTPRPTTSGPWSCRRRCSTASPCRTPSPCSTWTASSPTWCLQTRWWPTSARWRRPGG